MDTLSLNGAANQDVPPVRTEITGPNVDGGGEVRRPPSSALPQLLDDERGQFGESLVLAACLDYYGLGDKPGCCVEVGALDGIEKSNTLFLRRRGWRAFLYECNDEAFAKCQGLNETDTTAVHVTVTPENINDLLVKAWVPTNLDLLSIDIDGMDYHVWAAMDIHRPKFVVIEVTDSHAPFENDLYVPEMGKPIETAPYKDGRLWSRVASRKAMAALARSKDYVCVAMTRTNLIFAAKEVVDTRPIKLNLGGGFTFFPGQILVDAMVGDEVCPLAYGDKSVAEVRASHVLEHFSHRETFTVLRDWHRVLEPGGKMRVAVPNGEWLLANRDKVPAPLWEAYLFGGHTDENDKHGTFFTPQKLRMLMARLGLDALKEWKSDINDCAALPVSLNMEGKKRSYVVKEKFRTIAVLSQPRWAPTDAMICLHKGLRALGQYAPQQHPIDTVYCGGAYWEKYLTKGIERAMEFCERGDYLLFADYDGVFCAEDVDTLIKFMQDNPDVSAVFAVQPSRHNDKALSQYDEIDYSGETSDVVYGHFGCTIVRVEAFEFLPKPWLWSIPGDGNWKEQGHCDADILFWRTLSEHGHRVCQHNKVQVGHMDQCVKWLTPQGIMYQPIGHYNKTGRPKNAEFCPRVQKADIAREDAIEKANEFEHVEKPANPIVLKGD